MKSIWTGTIGFGLVSIPVKLYSATTNSDLSLDMLDKKDNSHIKYMRVNETTGKEVAWENIVKGYDYNGKYVVLDTKDFEAAQPEKTKNIDIFSFVKVEEIDSIYFENPYFLEPGKNGNKPYALLREAMAKSSMAGLGSFVMRNKEHLVIVKVHEDVLLLNQLRFAEEVRSHKDLAIPAKSTVKPAELKMATDLIKSMTEPFEIEKYKDTYTEKLMKLIEDKAKGKLKKAPTLRVAHKQTNSDLMDQLKASLAGKKKKAS